MSPLEGLREGCELCYGRTKGWKIALEGTIDWRALPVHWVVLIVPADHRSVSDGEHFLFTTDMNHVGTDIAADLEVRDGLMLEARKAGQKLLGHFRLGFNEGPEVASFDHFHIHLIKPGPNERMVSLLANVPRVIDDAAASGLISSEADEMIKNRVLQKPRKYSIKPTPGVRPRMESSTSSSNAQGKLMIKQSTRRQTDAPTNWT